MTDFLDNLLLRSGRQLPLETPMTILQPRLPALFETPQTDPIRQETFLPPDELSAMTTAANEVDKSPTGRSTMVIEPIGRISTTESIVGEEARVPQPTPPSLKEEEHQKALRPKKRRLKTKSIERDQLANSQPAPVSLKGEHQSVLQVTKRRLTTPSIERDQARDPQPILPPLKGRTRQSIFQRTEPESQTSPEKGQLIRPKSIIEEPRRTILMHSRNDIQLSRRMAIIQGRSTTAGESKPMSQMEHSPLTPQQEPVEENPFRMGKIERLLRPKNDVQAILETHHFEGGEHLYPKSVRTQPELKTSPVVQPVSVPSRLAPMQPSEQSQIQESQQIIEIHIGRIEVRATPPPTPLKQSPQRGSAMSLDDYLRARSGDRR